MARKQNRPENAQPMVAWYDPRQLIKTGLEVFVSTIIGRHSDHRIIEAIIASKGKAYRDYTYCHEVPPGFKDSIKDSTKGERKEIWIDYVADTGDGWDPTYAVAYALAHPNLCITSSGGSVPGQRGALMIMGGDQVYPTASRKEYRNRLITPYEAALKTTAAEHPQVLSIPGNHDWYDSLVSFSRVFLSKDWFAGWFAPQDRSYFACKLPGGWWLLGIDTQLGADIDGPQVEYFENVETHMTVDDRVILCCAEPQWIMEKFYSAYDKEVYNDSNLHYLNDKILKDRVRVFVAGDLHHYRRHANVDGVQKITCGGGGAFLHPTHAPKAGILNSSGMATPKKGQGRVTTPPPFIKQAAFPDEKTSRRLTFGNFLFPFLNPRFGLVCAALYFLAAWMFMLPVSEIQDPGLGYYLENFGMNLMDRPAASFWLIMILASVVLFTDTHSLRYRVWAGSLHGIAHVMAILILGWLSTWIVHCLPFTNDYVRFAIRASLIFLGGWFFGSMIMGLYLLISLNIFGRHFNEAFSSLANRNYKCFLRFHVDLKGDLTIYPMGITRVPRQWKCMGANAIPQWVPKKGKLRVDLIEPPIKVPK
jgi:hypothetical protein